MVRIVVVGGGLAGSRSIAHLREQGFAGELVMIGAERRLPYDRPPLSKRFLLDREPFDPALPFDADQLGVDIRLGVRATGLGSGVVHTETGDVRYDGLVIASGSEPIRLPGHGAHYLRTREDAAALRALLVPGARVVVVGAGWIAAEVTTAATRRGCQVVVLEQAKTPVAHALPPEIGELMMPWYAQAGAELRCGHRVDYVEPDGVVLAGGERVPADAVIVGVGVRPATEWLRGSAVGLDRGVLVGPDLRTGVPGIVAVGDVVARWAPRYGVHLRSEHWDEAMRSPAVAAANLLGGEQIYDPVPYVWSEQFGRMVQFGGRLDPDLAGVRPVWRGSPADDAAWGVYWIDGDDKIASLLTVDRPRDFVQGRKLATVGAVVDPRRLADPQVPVKAAVPGSGA